MKFGLSVAIVTSAQYSLPAHYAAPEAFAKLLPLSPRGIPLSARPRPAIIVQGESWIARAPLFYTERSLT